MGDGASEADTAARLNAWLLDMGFPRSTSRDHLLTICRGNYRSVWESLMRQVHPRSDVKSKRLQVFAADVKHCRSFEDDVHERIGASVICEELEVWRETQVLRKRVAQAEARVATIKRDLRALSSVVADKISQREHLGDLIKETRRRSTALHVAAEQYCTRGERLSEMSNIAVQLAPVSTSSSNCTLEIVEKCINFLNDISHKRMSDLNLQDGTARRANQFNSTAISNTSVTSEGERREQDSSVDMQDKLLDLLEGVGLVDMWDVLHKKQDQLIAAVINSAEPPALSPIKESDNPQSALAETSALHCKLVLRTLDMRRRASSLEKNLVEVMRGAVVEDDDEASRELLVLHCEEAGLRGRINVLHDELVAIRQKSGTYQLQPIGTEESSVDTVIGAIVAIDRDLVARKSEMEALLMSTEHTVAKIASVVTQLETLLPLHRTNFSVTKGHEISMQGNYDEFVRHFHPSAPDVSVAHQLNQLKEFYSTPQAERHNLSLDLDCSSTQDSISNELPKLVDELRFFLEKFHLHENRKLVLPNGESLWICETLENRHTNKHYSAIHELILGALYDQALNGQIQLYESGSRMRHALGWTSPTDIEISGIVKNGSDRMEHMLKTARNSIVVLRQTTSQLDIGLDNLKWWSAGQAYLYISEQRVVFGKGYNYYHSIYSDYMNSKNA